MACGTSTCGRNETMDNDLKWLIEDAKATLYIQQNAHQNLQAQTALDIEKLISTAFFKGMDKGIHSVAEGLGKDTEEV